MHSNMRAGINNKFNEMDEAFQAFANEMEAQGLWDNIILLTHSEFARTLDSNGGGSDHGWGGQQILFGGSVNGGQVFNTYPDDMSAGNYLDLGRGRLIPEYPWESMMDPIATWMGVAAEQKTRVCICSKNQQWFEDFDCSPIKGAIYDDYFFYDIGQTSADAGSQCISCGNDTFPS